MEALSYNDFKFNYLKTSMNSCHIHAICQSIKTSKKPSTMENEPKFLLFIPIVSNKLSKLFPVIPELF